MMMLLTGDEGEPQDSPLTPDGSLTLVDDYGSPTGQGKQFITITTKTGEYFYLFTLYITNLANVCLKW